MRTTGLLLLIALSSLSESHIGLGERSDQERPLVRSKRRWVLSTVELAEEDPGPYPKKISQMFNMKASGNHEFHISGIGVDQEPLNMFSIDSHTGDVFAHRPVDREQYEHPFHIKFFIYDKDTKKELDKEMAFDIEILDINDNAPTFAKPQMTIEVKENITEGYLPEMLHVTDRDKEKSPNSTITVSLISQEPKEPKIGIKQLYNTQAQLILKSGCFDYDKIKKYEVVVKAQDQGRPSLSSTAVITLNITDVNTHPPMFKKKEYEGEVMELYTKEDVLRVTVEDKDTPNTAGWRAKYFFIKGNEEENYEIKTDRETNEGILSVIKGKDYEVTSFDTLEVGVRNEEQLSVCKENTELTKDFYDTAIIKIKVKDFNDPPVFAQNPVILHETEEEKPGKVLFTPVVTDVDSDVSQIRYVLLKDPENWVTIDKKTGKITSVKKMDRESPVVNGTGVYNVLIGAIDNGEPPATATCTVQINLRDINDNKPQLVNKSTVICANKGSKVMVAARDADHTPFGGPFFFSLKNDEKILKQWKLDPSSGPECGLVSKKELHYGNYLVPLLIQDQQNVLAQETLEVRVCDCDNNNVCQPKKMIRTGFGLAGITAAFAVLFLLLLLFIFTCQCRNSFKQLAMEEEEGNSSLTKYNDEGGVSKSEPTLPLTWKGSAPRMDGLKKNLVQGSKSPSLMMEDAHKYNSSALSAMNFGQNPVGEWCQRGRMSGNRLQSVSSTYGIRHPASHLQSSLWNPSWSSTVWGEQRDLSRDFLNLDQHIANHIDRKLYTINQGLADSEFKPFTYTYEGRGSTCQSLDEISFHTPENFTFLNHLEPKFNNLGQICQQTLKDKDIEL